MMPEQKEGGDRGGACGCKVPSRGAVEKKEEEGGKDSTRTTTTKVMDSKTGVRDDMVFVEGKVKGRRKRVLRRGKCIVIVSHKFTLSPCGPYPPTPFSLSLSHTHTLSHTLSLSLTLSPSLSSSLSLSLSHSPSILICPGRRHILYGHGQTHHTAGE